MTKSELQQRNPQLGAAVPILADIANHMRSASPFHGQMGVAFDEVQAARQLGRHEGWFAACETVDNIHIAPTATERKPVQNYSQPANPQPPEKK